MGFDTILAGEFGLVAPTMNFNAVENDRVAERLDSDEVSQTDLTDSLDTTLALFSGLKLVRISTFSKLSGFLLVVDFYVRDFGIDTFAQK